MGKVKKKGAGESKALAKAAKKQKAEKKQAAKETKQIKTGSGKLGKKSGKQAKEEATMDESDFIASLEEHRLKWAAEHAVSEDVVDGPPSRRANATLTPCPVSNHLWLFGGEYFDGSTVAIYADLYRYSPDKNEWRRFSSPTQPAPRSAHQVVASPAGGGKLWLFGGEYSAPNQSSFFHHRDLWCFSIQDHTWERFDVKHRPSARSGHRMCAFRHLIFLFGGFTDTGYRTTYLGDLWCWDTLNYKWYQIEISDLDRKPGPRSGFSLLPCPDGIILHGGYTKTYDGKRSTGVGQALSDTWILRVPPTSEDGLMDMKGFKWEKRKKIGYAPSPRSGCTMALWQAKNMGVLFGGVSDEDKDEETLESTFYNELFGYNMAGTGRWISLPLKKKKKQGGAKKKKQKAAAAAASAQQQETPADEDEDVKMGEGGAGSDADGMDEDDEEDEGPKPWEIAQQKKEEAKAQAEEDDPNDPEKTIPMTRYNTMLAVQKNTLYIFGGILESADKEWTLDDFHSIQLDKLDRFHCYRECIIDNADWHGSDSENDSSDSEDDSGSDDGDDDENDNSDDEDDGVAPEETMEEEVAVQELVLTDAEQAALDAKRLAEEREELRKRATAFAGVSTSTDRTAEDIMSTPQPGESLAKFFARSKEYWTQKAHVNAGPRSRGKDLRRDGFGLAEDAYQQYLPLLEELARIQEQAGLDAAEAAKGARAGLGTDSRNRR